MAKDMLYPICASSSVQLQKQGKMEEALGISRHQAPEDRGLMGVCGALPRTICTASSPTDPAPTAPWPLGEQLTCAPVKCPSENPGLRLKGKLQHQPEK